MSKSVIYKTEWKLRCLIIKGSNKNEKKPPPTTFYSNQNCSKVHSSGYRIGGEMHLNINEAADRNNQNKNQQQQQKKIL